MSPATGVTAEAETRFEEQAGSTGVTTQVVLCLGPWYEDSHPEHLSPLLSRLRDALGPMVQRALVAYPVSDPQASSWEHEGMMLQPYLPSAKLHTLSIQTATSYLSLFEIMRAHSAQCGVLLGADAHTLEPAALYAMIAAVLEQQIDLALPCYLTTPNEGLVNTAVLYPLSRSLYGVKARFPLALDMAMSSRMAEKLAASAQRFTASKQPDAIVWPVAEAAFAGFNVAEIEAGVRGLPHPAGADLSTVLNTIASSLFQDIETKAAFWQRSRTGTGMTAIPAVEMSYSAAEPVDGEEISELVESFRIGYGNLHEIWSLVLPPQTLLGLKNLSRQPSATFAMPDALWVRIVYDFVLAHRLRTINRGHLMGSFTPLYLAWVASHLQSVQSSSDVGMESLAKTFEADKPYIVSRWRWPDRFNP